MLALGFIAIAVGRSFNSSLALPYYKTTLKLNEEQIGVILLVLTLFIIIAAPLWVHFSRKHGKARLFFVAVMSLAVLSAVVYPILPPKTLWPVLLLAGTGGILVASIVLLESLFSDLVEEEKSRQAKDVSGVYYGIWRMLSKVARALGIACSGLYLSLIGYEQGSLVQSPSIERSIAWAFGPGVAVFLAIGGLCIFRTRHYYHKQSKT
jgi:GPH family glycoside/pentoside/hexuronide:cation symporter